MQQNPAALCMFLLHMLAACLQDLKAQMARDKADVEAFLGQQSTQSAVKDRELTAAQVRHLLAESA